MKSENRRLRKDFMGPMWPGKVRDGMNMDLDHVTEEEYYDSGYGSLESSGERRMRGISIMDMMYLECCPIVVDPLLFTTLFCSIIGGTMFLNTLITMNIGKKRRRRRRSECGQGNFGYQASCPSVTSGRDNAYLKFQS